MAESEADRRTDEQDSWNAKARGETELQRLDRNMNELLQELRVAQTGVQILFAFLLTIAFTGQFQKVDDFARAVYVATLLCALVASGFLIAPVGYHRLLFQRRMKREVVTAANRLAVAGLAFLAIALAGALLLILDVVIGQEVGLVVSAVALLWLATLWFALPFAKARRIEFEDD
jgi:hypothetical protein